MQKKHWLIMLLLFIGAGVWLFASGGSLADAQGSLVIQIGILLFAVKLGGLLAQRFHIPGVLGELLVGVIIGPYALGGIAFPGFPHGLFGTGIIGAEIPVSTELYALATIASIILLFISGLETDLTLFLKYSIAGAVVGIGGVVFTFFGGALVGMLVFGGSFMDSQNLMFGIMSTATSIGITARILSEKKKLDTPEGVTILAAAVFDDVIGIVLLAVVLGINAATSSSGGGLAWGSIGMIALKAFGLWLVFTVLGLLFAKKIALMLKRFRSSTLFTVMAFGLALVVAGFFEKEGLAMIIGAYIIGLSLSKTDISHIIIEKMHVLYEFFVPIFFAVMGMLVDVSQFLDPRVLIGGLIFTIVAILGKLLGCGVPALFTGFNMKGALRIGFGMVPRGEVVLILAGIGLASGILPSNLFGVAIMMPLITALVAPAMLSRALALPGRGTRKESLATETIALNFAFPSSDVATLVTDTMTHQLQAEGFYIRTMDIEDGIAQVRKDDAAFSMKLIGDSLEVQGPINDMPVAQTAVFEAVAALNSSFTKLKKDFDPGRLQKNIASSAVSNERSGSGAALLNSSQAAAINPFCIIMKLQGDSKEAVIRELLQILKDAHKIHDIELPMAEIMERESSMSTGMQDGIAIPHAKSDSVEHLIAAVGLKPEGMDFASMDGNPTRIIVLSLSPKKNPEPHLQFLAGVGSVLREESMRTKILAAKNPGEVAKLFGV
ncbi:MAG: cation:proton antiporter [Spirochaetes bacterium]|nr:cation:proton antiporter [Spirochaetota bacterium]MBU0956873.1 cation:proton antiporter [Spirochaetota bacterium]